MKKNKQLSCLLFVMLLTVSWHTSFAASVAAPVFSDATKPILLTKGLDEFTITLPANRTTGYAWFITYYPKEIFTPIKHGYTRHNRILAGSGGTEKWIFKIKATALMNPQTNRISFLYARPWNIQDNPKKVTFQVVVQ